MERGVYFDAWFPRQHCYHPSLPPRRLRMVDDLVDYRATVLVWSAMGGGSLALPYLEQEAFGRVEPRARFYGFVNDSEFVAECHKHGIKVFGIVFEAQGWEFPVELNDDESEILALNELRGVGRRDWIGLREFSSNRYPKLWPPFEAYFPGGLVNSDGEQVSDLIDECVARDICQEPCHARWVECPDREHQCFYMDRNNPVWREYLKGVIRIQIDAGVDGIQLDEAELPMGAFQYGACFCKDCIKGFRAYLQAMRPSEVDTELENVDLASFHYGDWLLERGYDFKDGRESTPLFGDYYRYQCQAIELHFGELADYARAYGRQVGRTVLVSGNFFNCDPTYLALADDVDLVITEMRNTTYRQPEWYRYVRAFAGDKDVVVVENPYGGVVPELVDLLGRGRGRDLLRLSLYEGAAFGANMTAPYGSWMGATIEDSFYAPHDLVTEIQCFLADNDRLFAWRTYNEVAVVYSVESARALVSKADASDNLSNATDEAVQVPYRVVTRGLAEAGVPYDVVLFPDGVTASDRVGEESLSRYQTIVLPDCHHLTEQQAAALQAYLDHGGCAVVLGVLGDNLVPSTRDPLASHPGVHRVDVGDVAALTPSGPQVTLTADLAVNVARLADETAAVHLLDYRYDLESDGVAAIDGVDVSVRLPFQPTRATLISPGADVETLGIDYDGQAATVRLPSFRLYGVVVFEEAVR
jgi:Beta-galactosidase trimerisation domain